MGRRCKRVAATATTLLVVVTFLLCSGAGQSARAAETSALSVEPIPMKTDEELPRRTPPILEIGPPFLGTGNIDPGFELPTGAVWQPALWVFGNLRTAINYFDDGTNGEVLEWATSSDIFFNLRLSGTERILLGFTPLDSDGRFTTYTFKPDSAEGSQSELNADVQVLFFEGEIAEIFPGLDPHDSGVYDIGFSVGRQPIEFQEGIMFIDIIDSLGITRDSVIFPNIVDTRFTFLFGWNNINRNDNQRDENASVFGFFTESDLRRSTVALDFAYVDSDDDGFYAGLSSTQRVGLLNTTFRVNTSFALGNDSPAVNDGTLLFSELSYTPAYTDDLVYLNAFWGIDNYSSAARNTTTGGPLSLTGLLFASVGLGRYPPALNNRADNAVGGVVGYQAFFNNQQTQVVVEIGGRAGTDTDSRDFNAVALGARFQHALGERTLLQLDGYYSLQRERDNGFGLRSEIRIQF